jgi:hypothetical protein
MQGNLTHPILHTVPQFLIICVFSCYFFFLFPFFCFLFLFCICSSFFESTYFTQATFFWYPLFIWLVITAVLAYFLFLMFPCPSTPHHCPHKAWMKFNFSAKSNPNTNSMVFILILLPVYFYAAFVSFCFLAICIFYLHPNVVTASMLFIFVLFC